LDSSKPYRKKLVIIVSRFPFPLEKGDKLRAFHQIKELSSTYSITLIATTDSKVSKESIEQLRKYCSTIYIFRLSKISIGFNLFIQLFTKKPFQIGYFYSSKNNYRINKILEELKPDHILCQLIRVSEFVKNYHHCKKTIDYMDALSKGIERRIEKAPFYLKWLFRIEAKRLANYERQIFDYFENHIIISDQDRELILHPKKSTIQCVPNGVDNSFFEPFTEEKKYDLLFVGNMSYAPNIEAASYISTELIPTLKESYPNISFLISGANPHSSVLKLARTNSAITVSGWIDDIRTSYAQGKIFVAPMMIGTGMQNKLIEAMAMGIPCITTSLANNAIKAIHNESIVVANTKEEFIQEINKLLSTPIFYDSIAKGGKLFVKENYNWQSTTNQLKTILES
jgi:sugar transferase (PEP-CTERM/EpsH1 system associated)